MARCDLSPRPSVAKRIEPLAPATATKPQAKASRRSMRNTRKPPLTVVGVGRLMRCWAAWGVALAVIGCQQPPPPVKGQVPLEGKPLSIGKGMRGTVVFQPTVASGTTLTGLVDSNSRYPLGAGG